MADRRSRPNPLRPFSILLGMRAVGTIFLAIYLLLESAPELMAGFTGPSPIALLAVLTLLSLGGADAIFSFRTGLRLPARSLDVCGIGETYDATEIEALVRSGTSPNEGFLSWHGGWAARASDPFLRLPVPYQRQLEVAFNAIAVTVATVLVVTLLTAFARAGGKPGAAEVFISWLVAGLVALAYAYWGAMLRNLYLVVDWGWQLSVRRVVAIIGLLVVLLVLIGLVPNWSGLTLKAPPPPRTWSLIALYGSVFLVLAIVILAWLRSRGPDVEMSCSRIQESGSAAVHPESLLSGFRRALVRKGGVYSEIGDWTVALEEHKSGGIFQALAVGEYGAALEKVGLSTGIRRFASFLAFAGIGAGAYAHYLMWSAAREVSPSYLLPAGGFWLFGTLVLLIAIVPLSETLWTSYLLGVRVRGSYQGRGTPKPGVGERDIGWGSLLTDYVLDGGVARAESVSYLPAFRLTAEAPRVLVNTVGDRSEMKAVMQLLGSHLAQAAGIEPNEGE